MIINALLETKAVFYLMYTTNDLKMVCVCATRVLFYVSFFISVVSTVEKIVEYTKYDVCHSPYIGCVIPPLEFSRCVNPPLYFTLENSEGTIHWFENRSECLSTIFYKIVAPKDYGIVLLFNVVALRLSTKLDVFLGHNDKVNKTMRTFTSTTASSLAPLLVRHDKVLVRVKSSFDQGDNKYAPRVNFSYFRHPLQDMPVEMFVTEIDIEKDFENNWNSKHKYNCSLSSNIPQAIRCDMVKQCIGGEDEHNCSYRKPGCEEEWISYKDICVSYRFSELASKRMSFSTIRGQRLCNNVGGILASEPSKDFLELIRTIIRQSGYISASIGISKYSPVNSKVSHLYRSFWQWGGPGGVIAHDQTLIQRDGESWDCAMLQIHPLPHLRPAACDASLDDVITNLPQGVFCTKSNSRLAHETRLKLYKINFTQPSRLPVKFETQVCLDGSYVHKFADCYKYRDVEWPYKEIPPMNDYKGEVASYTLDCRVDEYCYKDQYTEITGTAQVDLDGSGMSDITNVSRCPETHFQCPDWFCIPFYLVKNGEQDCLNREDESIPNGDFACPGFYRCQEYGICLHSDYMCDGVKQCPLGDDETYCNLTCPENCTCFGLTFKCNSTHAFSGIRTDRIKLDLSGTSNASLLNINSIKYLEHLNSSSCNLYEISLINMPYLENLDLSFNDFNALKSIYFSRLYSLRHLNLSHNPFLPKLDSTFSEFIFKASIFFLETLGLTNSGIKVIEQNTFMNFTQLTVLDLSGNDIKFNEYVLSGLINLRYLKSDVTKLCCETFLPPNLQAKLNCISPVDELSSCSDLLRSDFLRAFLWIISILAIAGNAGVLFYRLAVEKQVERSSYCILIINLSLADTMMGVYMTIVGSADLRFQGQYVMKEDEWMEGKLCHFAGMLALVASEMSAFVIFLISLDRTLKLCFPFNLKFHFTKRSSLYACGIAWTLVVILATVPILPFNSDWRFYSQNGICIPLPITRRSFPGENFAFSIFVVLNLVLFISIGVCQALLYYTIKKSIVTSTLDRREQDMVIARRLLLIIFTNFCCWFPICVMGVLASNGTAIPGEVNAWAAVFILPLNSALNPFLYTLNVLLERGRNKLLDQHSEKMLITLQEEIARWPVEKRNDLLLYCYKANLIEQSLLTQWLQIHNIYKENEQCKDKYS